MNCCKVREILGTIPAILCLIFERFYIMSKLKKGTEYAGHEVKQGADDIKKDAKSVFSKIKKPF